MLIKKTVEVEEDVQFDELMKKALAYLPPEQIRKFKGMPELLEKEMMNEAREPEMERVIIDLFSALREHNAPKLIRVLQGDKKKIFYEFKRQLEQSQRLTKREAKVLSIIEEREISLLSIALIKD